MCVYLQLFLDIALLSDRIVLLAMESVSNSSTVKTDSKTRGIAPSHKHQMSDTAI